MKLLLCSDIHRDHDAAHSLVERSSDVDVLVCAGDLAVMRQGLQPVVDILSAARCPAVLVPGNGESFEELDAACAAWDDAHVLHGGGCQIGGVSFWGLGGAVPVTPFGAWSYDFTEAQARSLLAGCPDGAVLVTHSPPYGHVDTTGGDEHLGSRAVVETTESARPRLVVCGHIHACWEQESALGDTRIVNAGPKGVE
ncbi:MAG: serine/threonine protein phosphatase, partial [Acidimicrobiia bacterium]|nr:serine/threonine protein phosphatase [Acidimicrobiia bacterium]